MKFQYPWQPSDESASAAAAVAGETPGCLCVSAGVHADTRMPLLLVLGMSHGDADGFLCW